MRLCVYSLELQTVAVCSFLDDAHLGGAEDAVTNLPASLHDNFHCVVFIFRLGYCEHCFVQLRIKLLALGVVRGNLEAFEYFVHDLGSHVLAFHIRHKFVLDCLDVLLSLGGLDISVLDGKVYCITHLEKVLGKLSDGKLLLIFNHFTIAYDRSLILFNLLRVLDSRKLNLLLSALSLSL